MYSCTYIQFVRYPRQLFDLCFGFNGRSGFGLISRSVLAAGHQFLIGRFVPGFQALLLLVGQREIVDGLVDGRDQLGVDRGKRGVGDVPAPESAADDHAEGVGIDVLDAGGGFDNAASDEASPLPDQFGRSEAVGENIVVQTGDTTEPINRDGTDFTEKRVNQERAPDRPSYLLSLSGLALARTRAEHLDDGVGSNGGKTVCDGTIGKFLNGLLDFLDPNIAFLYRDADVGVLVEHLVYRDEVLIVFVMATSKTSVQCGTSG